MISMTKHHKHEEHNEEHSHEEHKHVEHKSKTNYWLISTIALAVLLVAVVAFYSLAGTGGGIGAQAATDKAVKFINDYMLSGVAATAVSTEDTGSLYKISLDIAGSEVDVYVTKNGSLLFPSVVNIDETPETEQTTEEVPKTAKPVANAFIMSHCPYGLQFLKAYVPVIELLGDKADLEINFVHYIMHGKDELDDNNRIYCIQKEQNDKLTDYLRCFVENGDYESCLASTGIDTEQLDACIAAADEEFKITEMYNDQDSWLSGSYPQYLVDAELATQYGVGGSPTFVLNGQTISVTRSAEAIKEAVCDAFTTPPAECDQTLSNTPEAPSWGPIGSGSGSETQAQC
jgi:protein-disulfide isomerase